MIHSRTCRIALFLALLLVFAAALGLCLYEDTQVCMGVKILTEKNQSKIQEYVDLDLSWALMYNDQPAAVDVDTATIYIPQNIQSGTRAKDLSGKLAVTGSGYYLSFVPDEAFSDLASAVREGHTFKLNVVDNVYRCMQYHVVFTTLPVLRLDGVVTGQDEEQQDLLEGDLCLWTPEDPETERYSAKSSSVQWHLRGYSSLFRNKKSWKLSLKDEAGLNKDLNFLGLGKDDDWILNAMASDDTNLKEKIFIDLWNDWAVQNPWNYKMSDGEYVEVVRNGTYSGVYLLQRRIDRKYYRLMEDDILLKGRNTELPQTLHDSYEVIYSPLGETETLALMDGILSGTDSSMIHLDNFLDVNLFLQYGSAIDNAGIKNTFYLLKWRGDSYQLYMIPWDTDMSWGVTYITDFAYDYQRSMNELVFRREYSAMLQKIPDLKMMMSLRWAELRQSVFSEEHVLKLLEENQAVLKQSGAFTRDQACWGQFFNGKDTAENLSRFLQERLVRLDEFYLS